MPPIVILRPVVPGDEPFLYRLYASTRESEMSVLPLDERRKAVLIRMQFDAQQRDYTARYRAGSHNILLVEGLPVGRIWICETAGEILIVDLAILPEFRRRGIGRAVLRFGMERAARSGKPLRHSVLRTNEPAIRFYDSLGYKQTGEDGVFLGMEWRAETATSVA